LIIKTWRPAGISSLDVVYAYQTSFRCIKLLEAKVKDGPI